MIITKSLRNRHSERGMKSNQLPNFPPKRLNSPQNSTIPLDPTCKYLIFRLNRFMRYHCPYSIATFLEVFIYKGCAMVSLTAHLVQFYV